MRTTTPRKRPIQKRSKETVRALVQATAYILKREGYEKATTNRIAEKAGVNIGSLYQYFPNKEALVAALIDRMVDRYVVRIGAVMDEIAGAPVETILARLIEAHTTWIFADPALQRALVAQIPRVDRLDFVMRTKARLAEMLEVLLLPHARRGVDVERLASVVVNLVDALTQAEIFAGGDGARSAKDAHDAASAFLARRL
jgi:AcrR family transcriptional regulator